MIEEFLWVEKYRPKTIADTILPKELKQVFQQYVEQKNIQNLILAGDAGVGKTTVARAMLEELDCDYLIINGSMNGNIDTLRNDIQNFASSMSLTGKRKYVILDEADYLNPNSTQPALRNFMEEFSRNCGFILTCNFKNRIITPLHSRCTVIDFKIPKEETPSLALQFMKRIITILNTENVEFDKAVIVQVIQKYFPDWRRIINEIQRYSASGKIDSGILANFEAESINDLIDLMKDKNYSAMRNWVNGNIDKDVNSLFRQFYDQSTQHFKMSSVPSLVLLLGKYQYQAAFSADPEINFMAFLTECMIELEFND